MSSGLFDANWYASKNPDVAPSSVDPLRHYLLAGAAEGRDPGPLFSAKWYLESRYGNSGAPPNPLLDFLRNNSATEYVEGIRCVRAAHMFDSEFYRSQTREVSSSDDTLVHFLLKGERLGLLPYPSYEQRRALAKLHLRKVRPGNSAFLAFAALQVSDAKQAVRDNAASQRRTWLTPTELKLQLNDGVFRRTFAADSQATDTPALEWDLDPATASAIVIPFVASGPDIRSIAISVEGAFAVDTAISMRLAMSPDGDTVIDGNAIYEPKTSQIIWIVGGGAFNQGQRYFLHINLDRPSGLKMRAILFNGAALSNWRLVNVELGAAMALPSQWLRSSWQRPSVALVVSPANPAAQTVAEQASVLFPKSDIHVIQADRSDIEALNILGQSSTVVIDRKLFGGLALGRTTSDLIRFLSIHGAKLVLLQMAAACDQKDLEKELLPDGPYQESLRYFTSTLRWNDRCPQTSKLTSGSAEANPQLYQPALEEVEIHLPSRPFDGRLPHVAIVSVFYGKSDSLKAFLESIYRQSYSGAITVVLVDDDSPKHSLNDFEAVIDSALKLKPSNIEIKIVRNAANLGNCRSRNVGIEATNADICVVIDSDCLINGHFVRSHVAEHMLLDTDAVLGPYNIESNGVDEVALLRRLENDAVDVAARANLQDPLLNNAFVNTVTRNLSIRRRWYDEHGGFDPALSYSADSDTGYGWEDIELGARIHAAGGTIRYTPSAFSIHLTHASSLSSERQAKASAKNFVRLVKKHDFIRTVARRWYVVTADRIVSWAHGAGTSSPDVEFLNTDLESGLKKNVGSLLPYLRGEKPPYRVLTHRWHVPHQYEIYKLPIDITLVAGTGTPFTNQWEPTQRPLPSNVKIKSVDEIDLSDYDMAIVHFDENVLCPDLSNSVLGKEWGRTFDWFLTNVKLPMVGVCHGTPPFVGQYGANPNQIDNFTVCDADVENLRRRLWNIRVVLNSHQADREWRFNKSKVIWHGYDPQEIPNGTHELDIVSHGVDLHRPHYRGAYQLRSVLDRLDQSLTVSAHKHQADVPVPSGDRRYSEFAFRNWLTHLGRHKVYLNTTLRSPMPRSRTEAMMCGTIPISLDNHDVSQFIRNDVNGYYSNSLDELADYCNYLCKNPAVQKRVALAARQTAIDVFNHDRFLNNWASLIDETVGS